MPEPSKLKDGFEEASNRIIKPNISIDKKQNTDCFVDTVRKILGISETTLHIDNQTNLTDNQNPKLL